MVLSRAALAAASLALPCASAAALGSYNVDPSSVSVSGLSSGGFMAGQLGVAYSDTFKTGFGVFAAGPYDCARHEYYTFCMYPYTPSIILPTSNMESWSGSKIDNVDNLKDRKIYLEVGTADTTVGVAPMRQLESQLASFWDSSKVSSVTNKGVAHTFPTDFDSSGNNVCGKAESPYISNCGYDGAGAVLEWMYGGLTARNDGSLSGNVVSFDQTGSYGSGGLAGTAYLYVPAACKDGSTVCKLHVALHGCKQSYNQIGSKFIDNTGYNKWADTNNIIILYPQTIVDYVVHTIWGGTLLSNPNACFDWIGWYGNDADQKGGAQVSAIVNQVNQIISGYSAKKTRNFEA